MNSTIDNAKHHFTRGLDLLKRQNYIEAAEEFSQAHILAPDRISTLVNLSATLIQLCRWPECEKICRKILSLEPKNYDALLNLGVCLSYSEQSSLALEYLNQAIDINPSLDLAWINKGNILQEWGDINQASLCFDTALSINALSQEALIGRGNLRNEKMEYLLALEDFDAALAINPSNPKAKWNKALSLLRQGNFEKGWELYESRWEISGMREQKRHTTIPLWLGEKSLNDKTILIYTEQGYGDAIQFSRYAPMLESKGANVIIEAPKSLMGLLTTLSPTIKVIENGSLSLNTVLYQKIDFQCPIMSLALAFQTKLETIPKSKFYLSANKNRQYFWKVRLNDSSNKNNLINPKRVGLTWSGSGHYAGKKNLKRDVPLKEITHSLSHFAGNNIEFHSLQISPSQQDLTLLAESSIYYHHEYLDDFLETACLINELDLIISVDTSVAHLSGALGKETWILLPSPPDFMALIDSPCHPWYDNTKFIRQVTPKKWTSVMNQVSNKLNVWLNQDQ